MTQKIEYSEPYEEEEVKQILHPIVKEWFYNKYKNLSLTQLYGVKPINDRKNILISAPTGGTKTLTAFLAIINYLVRLSLKNELENKIYAVYTSPLKALTNDIYVNLEKPLQEIREIAKTKKLEMQEIRVALRTGDTTPTERARMARKPPHIFVTTPESLAIVLTTKKFSENLHALEYIIVDEIHALANKRGVYLSLTLERLQDLSSIEPVRVGLSATIAPIEEIAKFLVGNERDCYIAKVKLTKKIDISLLSPGSDLLEIDTKKNQQKLYHLLDELIDQHRTTLIFTNTRAATEKIIHHLDQHFPGKYTGLVGAHHSSMSKERRFEIEERLRKGELKVAVSSTSLELGIDIGNIDLVVLLRSPKSVARALQRIGRAGHKLHSNPKGKFVVMDRDDLVESAILMKNMKENKIDKVQIPKNALDALAQQIYGMAISRIWNINDMLKSIRKSYCYKTLSKEDFLAVISYLSGDYDLENSRVYAKIWYDQETGQIGKKGKLARVLYMTNIGTIPEEGFVEVIIRSPKERAGQQIGKIDEGFLEKIKKGDVFTLGGTKYQYAYSKGMKAYVNANVTKNPTIPSWFSEQLPLSQDVANDIGKLRRHVKERINNQQQCEKFLQEHLYLQEKESKQIYEYFKEQQEFSEIPTDKEIIIEKFKQDKEHILFHTMLGRRINDALSRAYAYAATKTRGKDIEIGINDNGFTIAGEKLNEEKIISYVTEENIEEILKEAIEKTDVLKRRFRHCASRSLMILRNYKGRSKSVGKQQVHSHFLLAAIKKISNEFPILQEARREVLQDLMDVKGAKQLLKDKESNRISMKTIRTPMVSPFGLNLIMQSHADLIRMEDKAAFLKRMHQLHLKIINK